MLAWILGVVAGLIALAALAVALGYTRLPPRNATVSRALAPGTETWLDRQLAPLLAVHPDESGFALVADGLEAFALRMFAARCAMRSLDVQYYIWKDDLTGRLLVHELLAAADRGVRVRVLLDDLDARAKNFVLAALDAHSNIEIRVFNPFASRSGLAGKLLEAATAFARVNHRMHNKSFIVDNRIAITGGRNIGDEYFSASERMNFLDLDLAMVGPAVLEMSAAFDDYWNAQVVWPMAALNQAVVAASKLAVLRERAESELARSLDTEYARSLAGEDIVLRILTKVERLHWIREWRVLSDDPRKASFEDCAFERSAVLRGLDEATQRARQSISLVSPYFVPGAGGTRALNARAQAGVAVGVLTNSLAATDVAAVHGGYAKYRKALLRKQVELWELKPSSRAGRTRPSLFGSSRASLHTKAAVFDSTWLFIGSFNLDPRSVSLNCEHGVLIEDAAFSREVAALIEHKVSSDLAWQVLIDPSGLLAWTDGEEHFQTEPRATLARRALAKFVGWLPFEAYL